MTRSYAERVADYHAAKGSAMAEAKALFGGAKWIDIMGALPQDRPPFERPRIGDGLTIVAAKADYVLWCACVDEHLEAWDETSSRHLREPTTLREAMSGIEGDQA